MNITKAVFANERTVVTEYLWAYDYGQILEIEGIELPAAFEVHFCNVGSAATTTQIGTNGRVAIPDTYLTSGADILAYIYLHTGATDGETEYKIQIPVRQRATPTHETPTPVQQSELEEAVAALNAAVTECNAAVSHYPKIVYGYWTVWDAANGEWVDTGVQAEGEDGVSPTVTITEIQGGHRVTITDADHPDGQSFDVMDGTGGGGGTSDYSELSNKPSIEGVTLSGNKTAGDLGLAKASDIPSVPVQSVNSKTGAVVLSASDVGAATPSDLLPLYPHDTATGSVATFTDGADDIPVRDLSIAITPVQSGSGDPAPDNVRPITGWTGANVQHSGLNLFKKADSDDFGGTLSADGLTVTTQETTNSGNWNMARLALNKPFTVKNGQSVYLSFDLRVTSGTLEQVLGLQLMNSSNQGMNGWRTGVSIPTPSSSWQRYKASLPITASGTVVSLYFQGKNASGAVVEVSNIMLSCDPKYDYVPFDAFDTYPISWQTEAGTVYGGTLDVTTGLLTVTHANIASYNGESINEPWISSEDVYSEGGTPTTGAQVVYPLATPQTYQLTATEVKTLLGDNAIWADTGDTTVDYRADPTLYCNKFLTLSTLPVYNGGVT